MGRKHGFSFSWKRAVGISAAKGKIARATGIPTTKSGRQRKVGRLLGGFGLALLLGSGKRQPTRKSLGDSASPTQKQIDYLARLGYSGKTPNSKGEASVLIDAIKSGRDTSQVVQAYRRNYDNLNGKSGNTLSRIAFLIALVATGLSYFSFSVALAFIFLGLLCAAGGFVAGIFQGGMRSSITAALLCVVGPGIMYGITSRSEANLHATREQATTETDLPQMDEVVQKPKEIIPVETQVSTFPLPVQIEATDTTDEPDVTETTLPASSENPIESAKWRIWTSTVGTTIDAQFITQIGQKVKLRKRDESIIEVPLDKLSIADRDFIQHRDWLKVAP